MALPFFPYTVANQLKNGDWISLLLIPVTLKRFSGEPLKGRRMIMTKNRNIFIDERYLMTSLLISVFNISKNSSTMLYVSLECMHAEPCIVRFC